jgi:hypothetical protein
MAIAVTVLQKIFSSSLLGAFNYDLANPNLLVFAALLIILLMVKEYFYLVIPTRNTMLFYVNITLLLIACYVFGVFNYVQFIYFQF